MAYRFTSQVKEMGTDIETLFRKRATAVRNNYVWRHMFRNVSYLTGLDIYFLEI
jgi:hypothetical protein